MGPPHVLGSPKNSSVLLYIFFKGGKVSPSPPPLGGTGLGTCFWAKKGTPSKWVEIVNFEHDLLTIWSDIAICFGFSAGFQLFKDFEGLRILRGPYSFLYQRLGGFATPSPHQAVSFLIFHKNYIYVTNITRNPEHWNDLSHTVHFGGFSTI